MTPKQQLQAKINRLHDEFRITVAEAICNEPNTSYEHLARRFDVSKSFIFEIARAMKVRRTADRVTEVSNG